MFVEIESDPSELGIFGEVVKAEVEPADLPYLWYESMF